MVHKSTDKTGPQLATLTITRDLLEEWNCEAKVAGMVFDTTSANIGAITAHFWFIMTFMFQMRSYLKLQKLNDSWCRRNCSTHFSSECISVQIALGRELLWLACRHHAGEVLLTHAWNSLKVEVSDVFLRYRLCIVQYISHLSYAYVTRCVAKPHGSGFPLPQLITFSFNFIEFGCDFFNEASNAVNKF